MKSWQLILGLTALALLYYTTRAVQRGGVVEGAQAVGEDITRGAANVFYALTQDSKANEEKYAPAIADAEQQNGIPAGLLHRQLFQESRYRTDIITGETVSSAGALGIAQIVPKYHPDADPLDPVASIYYAAGFMANLYRRFGSWRLALAAYNAGPGAVQKYNGIPPFPETQKYVADITSDVEVA